MVTAVAWKSGMTRYPVQTRASYPLDQVGLIQAVDTPDLVPADPQVQAVWARALACEATVYGLPAVYQYVHMSQVALDPQSPSYVGFNAVHHDHDLAGPNYPGFKTPNADTLYSHAWLDLRSGPVELFVPAMGERYYNAHFLDAWSNAVNLSTRTLGPDGGRVWLATTDWAGAVPEDVAVLRVATPLMWLLLRVFVRDRSDLPAARSRQEAVTLIPTTPPSGPDPSWRPAGAAAEDLDVEEFLEILDRCLLTNGHPTQEDALAYRLRGLGLGGRHRLDPSVWTDAFREAIALGHADALAAIVAVRTQRGEAAGEFGWRTLRSGAYGFNYLHRAATNHVGLGATVREESGAYTTFVDGSGSQLTGRQNYRLRLKPPPPVDAFWSLSAYDVTTREFVVNDLGRYSLNDQSPGLVRGHDGSVEIQLTATPSGSGDPNLLPVPPGEFYLVLRAYLGREEVVDGSWTPPPVLTSPD